MKTVWKIIRGVFIGQPLLGVSFMVTPGIRLWLLGRTMERAGKRTSPR